MELRAAATTDTGRVRTGNEDAFLIDARLGVYAVADGMGGHRAGEVASATALEALRAAVAGGARIDDAVERANAAVVDKAGRDPELRGMGTTITVLCTAGGDQLIGQVGDSRAYLLRAEELARLTEDHSLVEELVRDGRITPEQAQVHPQRSIITRALGIDDDVEVDLYRVRLRTGDRLLLCSDGLTSMVREPEIGRVLRREGDPRLAAEALVAAANEAGGEDNVTAVVVDVLDGAGDDDPDAPASEPVRATPTPVPAPEVEAPPAKERRGRRAGRALGRATRIFLVALPILLVFAIAIGAVGWYARKSYYVAFDGARVTVFQGRPGGVLGWGPTIAERSDVERATLTPQEALEVQNQPTFGSEAEALAYVRRLRARVNDRIAPPPAPPPAPPSVTTAAPATTVRPG